jgi:hypothetical protein
MVLSLGGGKRGPEDPQNEFTGMNILYVAHTIYE